MENLGKDLSELILLNKDLSPQDFINTCASQVNPSITKLCKQESLWNKRFQVDFPFLVKCTQKFSKILENRESTSYGKAKDFKKKYLQVFNLFLNLSREIVEHIGNKFFQDLWNNFTSEYKNSLYSKVFTFFHEYFKNLFYEVEKNTDSRLDLRLVRGKDTFSNVLLNSRYGYFRLQYDNLTDYFTTNAFFKKELRDYLGGGLLQLDLSDYINVFIKSLQKILAQ